MKIFKTLLLALCLPALIFQSIPSFAETQQIFIELQPAFYNENGKEIFIPRDENGLINPWGYFDAKNMFSHQEGYINHYFDFTKLICNEDFLETLSEEELDRIIEFTVWVVRYSVPESRPDLKDEYEKDIEELYQILEEDEDNDEQFYLSQHSRQCFSIQFAVSTYKPKILLCKKKKGGFLNQIKRKFGHFGHWCSKHKKTLIIGAVVVGTVVAAVLTGGVRRGPNDHSEPEHINKPGEVVFQEDYQKSIPSPPQEQYPDYSEPPSNFASGEQSFYEHPLPNNQREKTSDLEEIYQEVAYEADITKERILEATISEPIDDQDISFIDQAITVGKELSSKLAHGIIETVSEISKSIGIFGGIAGQIIDKNYQESLQEHFYHSHEAIDNLFETDIGYLYTEQGKEEVKYIKEKFGFDVSENPQTGLTLGEVLPPGLPLAAGSRAVVPKGGGAVGTAIVVSSIVGSYLPPVVPKSVEQNVMIYKAMNESTGETTYVGITNNFERRAGEQLVEKGIKIQKIDNMPLLSRAEAKAVEQTLIEHHELKKNGGSLINKINSIAQSNPKYAESLSKGREILLEIGYPEIE
jgi:hypothetical protein